MKRLIAPRFSSEQSSPLNKYIRPLQLPFIDEVKSKLHNKEYNLENYSCPCGCKQEDTIISEVDRYELPLNFVLCMKCGTIRVNPYLDQPSLENFYTYFYQQMYARIIDFDSHFFKQSNYGNKVLATYRKLKPGSWIFEVGCGAGGALKVFQDEGYKVAGCDYSAELIEAGRQRGLPNIYCGSLDAIQNNLPGVKAELIYLHHVFEHINDPLSFLQKCKKHLAPTGKILIIVPDVSTIDRFRTPAGNLMHCLHIAHKFVFSVDGIQNLCNRAGYSARRLKPNPKMQSPWAEPELWVEMTGEAELNLAKQHPNGIANNAGEKMLEYLIRTEKFYSVGLCQGQLLVKTTRLLSKIKKLRRLLTNSRILSPTS